jgi:hypothetical protein
MRWFRHHYGAGPLHLLSLVACLAFSGYIATRILAGPEGVRILVWFAGAAVAHDLVLWPLYAIADKGALLAARRHPDRLPRVPWVNHLRVPAVLSAAPAGGVVPAGVSLVRARLSRRLRTHRDSLPGAVATAHWGGVRILGAGLRVPRRSGQV